MSEYDAVVVGAGVVGSSVALELARGGRRTVLVDRAGAVGAGSTSASSAIVRFHYSTRDAVAVAWESALRWHAWADHLGCVDPAGMARFVPTGALVLEVPGVPSDRTRAVFDELGIPYERIDAATLVARYPSLDPSRFGPPKRPDDDAFWAEPEGSLGAYWTPDAGYIDDPSLAAHNLAHAAVEHGAELRLNRAVTEVLKDGDLVAGVRTADGAPVEAPVVVNAAGPWSPSLTRLAGAGSDFTVSQRALRQEVHHLAAPAGFGLTDGGTFLTDLDLGVYLRPHAGGGLLVGGTEPECDDLVWLDDPDDADPGVTGAVWEAQTLRAARRLPDLAVPPRPSGIVGVYDVTDDFVPLYDRTDVAGFYLAAGTSGNQFKNAPLVGEMVTTIIDGVESGHDHDAQPLHLVGRLSGVDIDLGYCSRRRVPATTTGTVMG